jgi:hypothetical protein
VCPFTSITVSYADLRVLLLCHVLTLLLLLLQVRSAANAAAGTHVHAHHT